MNQLTIAGAGIPYPGAISLDGGRSPDRPCSQSTAYTPESQGRGYRSPVSEQSGACHHQRLFPNKSPLPNNLVTFVNLQGEDKQVIILNTTANLTHLTSQIVNQVKHCSDDYIVKECKCGRHVYPKTCMSTKCEKCAPFAALRRAKRAFERLMFNQGTKYKNAFGVTINYTVFTLPPSIRADYLDPKKVKELRSKIWKMLKKDFGAFFGVQATHPIGDDSGAVFNPHLNFLWRARAGFRNFIDVNLLRAKYKQILAIDFEPDCHHKYFDNPAEIMHKCKYVLRAFPQFVEWCGNVQWYGSFPHINFSTEVCCGECMQNFKLIGYLSGIYVRDYLALGLNAIRAPPWENDDLIQHFKINPDRDATSIAEILHLDDFKPL